MPVIVNINARNLVKYTNALEKMHKSALPVAIRGTLNDVAFCMKKTAIPKIAHAEFMERSPNFFKANSRVEMAQGFNIKTMHSTVGFVSEGLHNSATNYAVRDLEEQEHGGTIHGRSFKPLPAARRGGVGNVKANSRISQLLKAGNIIDANDSKKTGSGKEGKMQQFILASIHAGIGGYVLGGNILWRVKRISRIGRNTFFTKEKLYSFKKSGVAKVHATGFMKKAAEEVKPEIQVYFRMQFQKQWKKQHGSYHSFY